MPSKATATKPAATRGRPPKAADPPVRAVNGQAVRTVDGQAVLEVRPVKSGLPGRNGNGVALKMNELLLADGSSRFDCVDCEVVEASRGLMMRHRVAAHSTKGIGRPRGAAAAGLSAAVRAMTLDTLIELAVQADATGELVSTLTEQCLAERARANAAEASLRKLSGALARAGFKVEVDA